MIVSWGIAIAGLYFLWLYLAYGVTTYFVFASMLENTRYISSAFTEFYSPLGHWLVFGPELMFTAGIAIGGAYFIDCVIKRRKEPVTLSLYLISLVSFVLHTHIFEFFRMI